MDRWAVLLTALVRDLLADGHRVEHFEHVVGVGAVALDRTRFEVHDDRRRVDEGRIVIRVHVGAGGGQAEQAVEPEVAIGVEGAVLGAGRLETHAGDGADGPIDGLGGGLDVSDVHDGLVLDPDSRDG